MHSSTAAQQHSSTAAQLVTLQQVMHRQFRKLCTGSLESYAQAV